MFLYKLIGCAVVLVSLCTAFSCRRTANSGGKQAVIDAAGTFPSPSGRFALTITVDTAGVVNYSIAARNSNTLIVSSNAGSKYSRWFFVWDATDDLWVHSSDIGGTVWFLRPDGSFGQDSPYSAGRSSQMPEAYFESLPQTMQRKVPR
jgi:hypothetical protein